MAFIERLYYWQMEKPKMFSAFHILLALLMYTLTALVIYFFSNTSRKNMKIIALIVWGLMLIMEVFKQLICSYNNGALVYNWSKFPFQFCELGLYVLPILILNKNEKLQNALISFLATFSMFAGLAILTLPFTGLNNNVFLNIRTLLAHGLQFLIGAYLFAWNRNNMNVKNFLYGSIIFIISVIIAITLNTIIDPRVPQNFDMFFLNGNYPTTLLILKHVQPLVPWFVFVLLYIICFYIIAFASFMVEHLVWRFYLKIKSKNETEIKYQN